MGTPRQENLKRTEFQILKSHTKDYELNLELNEVTFKGIMESFIFKRDLESCLE